MTQPTLKGDDFKSQGDVICLVLNHISLSKQVMFKVSAHAVLMTFFH
jgi:hypothetical protein